MPQGVLTADDRAVAVVLVTHACGERFTAELHRAGFATLLFGPEERLRDLVEWMRRNAGSRVLPIAVAARGEVVAAVVRLAAEHSDLVQAIVIDRAARSDVDVPTLIVESFGIETGKLAARWLGRVLAPYVLELV
jgi:hypothetical protein